MIIKSVELKNIRSYTEDKITFPTGSILLAGDIGCGKSTILHAIEFALFGLRKGEMSGSDLLRHGSDSGYVKLNFDIDENNIEIERTLKRGKAITQDFGSININGSKYELTPNELKSKVLELLGYSQSLLKKNKPLFRFTVYTPQEQIKSIMFSKEERLETLRTIFDIDKYGTIRNNAHIFMTEMRAMKRENEALSRDVDFDKRRLEELKQENALVQKGLIEQKNTLSSLSFSLNERKSHLEGMKKDFDEVNVAMHEIVRKDTEVKSKKTRLVQIDDEIYDKNEKIAEYEGMLSQNTIATLSQLKSLLHDLENKRDEFVSRKAVIFDKMRKLEKTFTAGVCEFCGQTVHNPSEFKNHIESERKIFEDVENEISKIDAEMKTTKESISTSEKIEHTRKLVEDIKKSKDKLINEKSMVESSTYQLTNEITMLQSKVSGFDNLKDRISLAEQEFYAIQKEFSSVNSLVARYEQQLNDIANRTAELDKVIVQKEKAREKIEKINMLLNWMDNFILLMENIEKHVMYALQQEFNQYFQKWFSILMSDQLSVKVDEDFSPLIEQNGYITEYENLSGGEKTSVALAYRLALNRVINEMIDTIKTKNLLILDEPTDGFSSDQLDRIRDVINELGMKQIIIVSHEQKIDSYVDNIIRIYKENHVSKIAI
ncbi:MAG: AAA family ATPase [Candidatus Aenigmarchaeota archaeon]|nr:AAA family ATPase [Candidatus Aenigmarchaeota archaeon]